MRKEYDFSQGKRGPVVPVQPGKTRITIRIDTDLLNWFREQVNARGGGNYQTIINEACGPISGIRIRRWKRPCAR